MSFLAVAKGLLGGGGLDKIVGLIPNSNERRQAEEEFQKLLLDTAAQADADQNAVNLAQVQHDSLFVAGARPFIMWVCGFGLAYSAIVQPLLQDILTSTMVSPPILTPVDKETLMPITMALLGIGGARSFEKYKGVSREGLRLKGGGFFGRFRRKKK
jgi:hypothetical protein